MISKEVVHLYNRAGFGLPLHSLDFSISATEAYSLLLNDAGSINVLNIVQEKEVQNRNQLLSMKGSERKAEFISRQQLIKELNFAWLKQLCTGKSVLREKMTLFWSNHFACRTSNPLFAQQLNNVIRENALGDFKTLVLEVSKSPAMLQFLNNQQNRKAHPNENFARELLELFTLGIGHYTEQDVSEAAKAFTGWTFNQEGQFEFKDRLHDSGVKQFMGKEGRFKGEDIIAILMEQKQVATTISEKFMKYFVNDKPDERRSSELANKFYDSGLRIDVLLDGVYRSKWFYNSEHFGSIIKSPLELMVPLIRDFNVEFANHNVPVGFQKLLGQVLFNPPNVAGWPGGRNWIDSSSLAFRMRMGRILLNDEIPDKVGKNEGDNNNAFDGNDVKPGLKNDASLMNCYLHFEKFNDSILFDEMYNWLITVKQNPAVEKLFRSTVKNRNKREYIKETLLFLTTLPEYQLC